MKNDLKQKEEVSAYSRTLGHTELISKGQLISKCPFGFTVWTKIPTKLFLDFCPEFFCSFLGVSWKLFGIPGDLVCNNINKEAYSMAIRVVEFSNGWYKITNEIISGFLP